nr:hypothetical protein GCM10020092_102490 [Actinoplanes digitatis]
MMTHWLRRGADGWRLDAAYAVPAEFWAGVLPRVRAEFPDAYVVGEVIHGDYGDFVARSTVDSVTQYELWKAVWSALNEGNFFELAWALDRHNTFLDTFVPQTFLGNHDVTRLASRLIDARHLPHALALLLTVGGTPSVYAGDEQGFTGVKEDREHGDDAVRPPFPARPDGLAPYGLAALSPAPGVDRATPAAPVAAPRPDEHRAPDQRAVRLRGRGGRPPTAGGPERRRRPRRAPRAVREERPARRGEADRARHRRRDGGAARRRLGGAGQNT